MLSSIQDNSLKNSFTDVKETNDMLYRLVEDDKAFYELRENWNLLLDQISESSPFLTWEWMYYWWQSYQQERTPKKLCIIVAEDENEVYAILPGFVKRERYGPFRLLAFHLLGTEFETSNYLEVICKEPCKKEMIFSLTNFLISQKPELDVLTISHILDSNQQLSAFKRTAELLKLKFYLNHYHTCLHVPIQDSWEDYIKELSQNTRYNWRRYSKNLQNQFQAELEIIDKQTETDEVINNLFDLHIKRFRAKNSDTFFKSNIQRSFHKNIAQQFLQKSILRLFQLKVDQKPIAIYYCFQYSGQMHFFQSGMDPNWDKYSPGFVLLGMIIQYTFERGLKEFDFGRGTDGYKLKWNPVSKEMMTLKLGISKKGKIALNSLKSFDRAKDWIKGHTPKKLQNLVKELLH